MTGRRPVVVDALLHACRVDEAPPQDRVERLSTRDTVCAVVDLAARHTVRGLVLRRLAAWGVLDALPATEVEKYRELLLGLRVAATIAAVERDRVLASLRAVGVEPLLIKGAVLMDTIYADRVERYVGDLDLLVRRDQLKAAMRALMPQGYRCTLGRREAIEQVRHHFHLSLGRPHGVVTELHWDVVRRGAAYRIDPERMLEDGISVALRDVGVVRAPCWEDHLLLIVLQNLQDGFSRLARFVDIDRIVRSAQPFDWDRLIETAHMGGLVKPLALSLRICERLLVTPVPAHAFERLAFDRASRLHLGLLRPAEFVLEQRAKRIWPASRLLSLWLLPSWREFSRSLRSDLPGLPKLLGYQAALYTRALLAAVGFGVPASAASSSSKDKTSRPAESR